MLFDTFGTVTDWRNSLIDTLTAFGVTRGIEADWTGLVDAWRREYAPSMRRVRQGDIPWTTLDGLHRASLEALVTTWGIRGLDADDLDALTRAWHTIRPWPDAVAGLRRLKSRYIIGPLSNGNVALLVDMAEAGGLPWDVIPGSDIFRHYKPDPEVYLGACDLLALEPDQVMMAAAHGSDLAAAQRCGLRTAFIPRPGEYGPDAPYSAQQAGTGGTWDVVASDIEDLATQLGT